MSTHPFYSAFLASIQARFSAIVRNSSVPVFSTNAEIWPAFLDLLPDNERAYYTCRTCQRFIETYGDLVTIEENGNLAPVLWDTAPGGTHVMGHAVGPVFAMVHRELALRVYRAQITGVFYASEDTWGQPVTYVPPRNRRYMAGTSFHHMAVVGAPAWRGALSAAQMIAKRREEHGMLARALVDYSLDVAVKARALLTDGGFYRADVARAQAEWFAALHEKLAALHEKLREVRPLHAHAHAGTAAFMRRDALLWRAVATAPEGFAHVSSNVLGTLLDDIKARLPAVAIKARWEGKLQPASYQRPTADVTDGQLDAAEKVVAKLGVATSLARRYARVDEVSLYGWRPPAMSHATIAQGPMGPVVGVFSGLRQPAPSLNQPASAVKMTWEKFARTVLPNAAQIEAQVPSDSARFMAMTTAADPVAPPILAWDAPEARNPFSWYYHAGIDGSIKERARKAGGQVENVDMRCTLAWNTYDDLDLHCVGPEGHIFYGEKRVGHGWLDVDMNAGRGTTREPVENIRWPRGGTRVGYYRFIVQNYTFHERKRAPVAFRAELEVFGSVYQFEGSISPNLETGAESNRTLVEFSLNANGIVTNWRSGLTRTFEQGALDGWSLAPGAFVPVRAIVPSPNTWEMHPKQRGDLHARHGRHVFFLLEGCRDRSEGAGRGLFVETLRGDLREARRAIEAYTENATVLEVSDPACGLGFSADQPWNVTLRVTKYDGTTGLFLIDRAD